VAKHITVKDAGTYEDICLVHEIVFDSADVYIVISTIRDLNDDGRTHSYKQSITIMNEGKLLSYEYVYAKLTVRINETHETAKINCFKDVRNQIRYLLNRLKGEGNDAEDKNNNLIFTPRLGSQSYEFLFKDQAPRLLDGDNKRFTLNDLVYLWYLRNKRVVYPALYTRFISNKMRLYKGLLMSALNNEILKEDKLRKTVTNWINSNPNKLPAEVAAAQVQAQDHADIIQLDQAALAFEQPAAVNDVNVVPGYFSPVMSIPDIRNVVNVFKDFGSSKAAKASSPSSISFQEILDDTPINFTINDYEAPPEEFLRKLITTINKTAAYFIKDNGGGDSGKLSIYVAKITEDLRGKLDQVKPQDTTIDLNVLFNIITIRSDTSSEIVPELTVNLNHLYVALYKD